MQNYFRHRLVRSMEATYAIENLPINEVQTDLLYTAFDDCRVIVEDCKNSYKTHYKELYESNKVKMVELGSELLRRGVKVIF